MLIRALIPWALVMLLATLTFRSVLAFPSRDWHRITIEDAQLFVAILIAHVWARLVGAVGK